MLTTNKKILLTSLLSFLLIFSFSVVVVRAVDLDDPTGGGVDTNDPTGSGVDTDDPTGSGDISFTLNNPFSGGDSLFALLRTILNKIVMPIGGVLAVLAFIYSGFLYVIAQGNSEKLKGAHRALLFTSVGTAILLGAWVLANAICSTIGLLGGPICPPL